MLRSAGIRSKILAVLVVPLVLLGITAGLLAAAQVDRARQAWADDTADTMEKALRSRAELEARGIDVDEPDDRVTAAEWLAADRADKVAEDPHRDIDRLDEDELSTESLEFTSPETAVPDIREVSVADPSEDTDQDRDSLPSAERTRQAVARAQAAMTELQQRETLTEPDDYDVYDPDTAAEEAVDEMVLD